MSESVSECVSECVSGGEGQRITLLPPRLAALQPYSAVPPTVPPTVPPITLVAL